MFFFLIEMDGFEQLELLHTDCVDLISVVPTLHVVCGLVKFSTYC